MFQVAESVRFSHVHSFNFQKYMYYRSKLFAHASMILFCDGIRIWQVYGCSQHFECSYIHNQSPILVFIRCGNSILNISVLSVNWSIFFTLLRYINWNGIFCLLFFDFGSYYDRFQYEQLYHKHLINICILNNKKRTALQILKYIITFKSKL